MSKKLKDNTFRFTFKVLVRLVIFSIFLWYAFGYLSSQTDQSQNLNIPPILSDTSAKPYLDTVYQQLPPESRATLENLDQNPVIITLKSKIGEIQQQLNGFPQTQIKEIQKAVIKNISDKLIESIDTKP